VGFHARQAVERRLSRLPWPVADLEFPFTPDLGDGDVVAGERYVELLLKPLTRLALRGELPCREYTHPVVAEIYAMLMTSRCQGKTGDLHGCIGRSMS
jgi:hypothetical protein